VGALPAWRLALEAAVHVLWPKNDLPNRHCTAFAVCFDFSVSWCLQSRRLYDIYQSWPSEAGVFCPTAK
jgi:hypothetical protein